MKRNYICPVMKIYTLETGPLLIVTSEENANPGLPVLSPEFSLELELLMNSTRWRFRNSPLPDYKGCEQTIAPYL